MKTYPLLLSILLVSGCVGIGDIFGGDVINVQQNVITNGKSDVLVIRDVITLPSPPLLPDQDVLLSFVLENQDTLKSASNVKVNLFNAPTFKDSNGQLCNSRVNGCTPDKGLCSISQPCNILPGEQTPINFDLRSPSESEIAGIKTSSDISYLVNYDFDSSLVYTLPVVDRDEIVKRQRAGEKTSITESKSHSSGPLQIDVSLQGAPYVLANQEAVMIFKLIDKGSGTIKDSEIPACYGGPSTVTSIIYDLPQAQVPSVQPLGIGQTCRTPGGSGVCMDVNMESCPENNFIQGYCPGPTNIQCCVPVLSSSNPMAFIEPFDGTTIPGQGTQGCAALGFMSVVFPSGFNLPEYTNGNNPNSVFQCTGSVDRGWTCINNKAIAIFKDESRVSLRFKIIADRSYLGGAPFKSYTIHANAVYTYELRNSLTVTINTFQNV